MQWKNVEEKCKIMFENHNSNGEIPLERRFLIQAIADEFPNYSRVRIAAVVDRGFKMTQRPISRTLFIRFLQTNL